jgi:hypothetical protein
VVLGACGQGGLEGKDSTVSAWRLFWGGILLNQGLVCLDFLSAYLPAQFLLSALTIWIIPIPKVPQQHSRHSGIVASV